MHIRQQALSDNKNKKIRWTLFNGETEANAVFLHRPKLVLATH